MRLSKLTVAAAVIDEQSILAANLQKASETRAFLALVV